MAKVKKQEILFFVAVLVLFAFVGLKVWLWTDPDIGAGRRQLMVAAQFALAAVFLVLLFLSFRQPLRRMHRTALRKPTDTPRRGP